MAYSIHLHLQFNTWANTQLANLLKTIPEEIYFRKNQSSFPSIAATMIHMWGAQDIWLRRLRAEVVSGPAVLQFENDRNATLDGFIQSSNDIEAYTRSRSEEELSDVYTYKNFKGKPFTDPIEYTLYHVVNHNTYHRGQIITMLKEAGVKEVVSTDLIHYLRKAK